MNEYKNKCTFINLSINSSNQLFNQSFNQSVDLKLGFCRDVYTCKQLQCDFKLKVIVSDSNNIFI